MVVSTVTIMVFLVEGPPAIKAAQGKGAPGVFVAQGEACRENRNGSRSCDWRGRFTSDDGSVRLWTTVHKSEAPGIGGVGDRARMLENRGQLHRAGTGDWIAVTGIGAGGLVLLCAQIVSVRRRAAKRRYRRIREGTSGRGA